MGILVNGVWQGGDDRQIGAAGWEPRQEPIKGYVRDARRLRPAASPHPGSPPRPGAIT